MTARQKPVKKPQQPRQSMADLMVQASIDRAMGNKVDDWLLEMLPDET